MSKLIDFDKFIQEKDEEYIEIKIFDVIYKVKKFIPAAVPIMMARAERIKDVKEKNSLNTKIVMFCADAFFGNNNVDEICAKGLSVEELSSIVTQLFTQINEPDYINSDTEEINDDDGMVEKAGSKAKK